MTLNMKKPSTVARILSFILFFYKTLGKGPITRSDIYNYLQIIISINSKLYP